MLYVRTFENCLYLFYTFPETRYNSNFLSVCLLSEIGFTLIIGEETLFFRDEKMYIFPLYLLSG